MLVPFSEADGYRSSNMREIRERSREKGGEKGEERGEDGSRRGGFFGWKKAGWENDVKESQGWVDNR